MILSFHATNSNTMPTFLRMTMKMKINVNDSDNCKLKNATTSHIRGIVDCGLGLSTSTSTSRGGR